MTIAPEGRKPLRLEVRNASTPIEEAAVDQDDGTDGPGISEAP